MSLHADDFLRELKAMLARGAECGFVAVEVSAGNLHRRLGEYPGPHDRMPMCCDIMRGEMAIGDEVVREPESGHGESLTIRYHLPR